MTLRLRSHRHAGRRDPRDYPSDATGYNDNDSPKMVLPQYAGPSYIEEKLTFKRKVYFNNGRQVDKSGGSSRDQPVTRSRAVEVNGLDEDDNSQGRTKRYTGSEHSPHSEDYDDGGYDSVPYGPPTGRRKEVPAYQANNSPIQRRHGYLRSSRRNDRLSGAWEDPNLVNDYQVAPRRLQEESYDYQGNNSCRRFEQFGNRRGNARNRQNFASMGTYQDGNFQERPGEFGYSQWTSFNGANTTPARDNQNYGATSRNQFNQGFPSPMPGTSPLNTGRQAFAQPAVNPNGRWRCQDLRRQGSAAGVERPRNADVSRRAGYPNRQNRQLEY